MQVASDIIAGILDVLAQALVLFGILVGATLWAFKHRGKEVARRDEQTERIDHLMEEVSNLRGDVNYLKGLLNGRDERGRT